MSKCFTYQPKVYQQLSKQSRKRLQQFWHDFLTLLTDLSKDFLQEDNRSEYTILQFETLLAGTVNTWRGRTEMKRNNTAHKWPFRWWKWIQLLKKCNISKLCFPTLESHIHSSALNLKLFFQFEKRNTKTCASKRFFRGTVQRKWGLLFAFRSLTALHQDSIVALPLKLLPKRLS